MSNNEIEILFIPVSLAFSILNDNNARITVAKF